MRNNNTSAILLNDMKFLAEVIDIIDDFLFADV